MKKVTDQELKQINLEMLCYFDKVCRENNIHYSITGGTLLGAVRHKGFIPWDDDVDVFLPRPEFEKLNDVFSDEGRYVWKTRKKDPSFKFVYGRLLDTKTIILDAGGMASEGQGIFLDVCVVDGLPRNKFFRILHIFIIQLLFRGRRTVVYDKSRPEFSEGNFVMQILKCMVLKTTDLEFWMKKLDKAMRRYPFNTGEYVGNFASRYGKRELIHRNAFDSYIDLEFEGQRFMACQGWEEYLKNIYGNYMELPPVEERKGHHVGTPYWVDELGED